jgi:hypothetical protein
LASILEFSGIDVAVHAMLGQIDYLRRAYQTLSEAGGARSTRGSIPRELFDPRTIRHRRGFWIKGEDGTLQSVSERRTH